jgi:hypothetical protein
VNTAEYLATLIAGKVIDLALIGAGYGAFRHVASRLSLAAERRQPQATGNRETTADPAQDGKRGAEADAKPVARMGVGI